STLYILMEGAVSVKVGGERVAGLRRKGDLIGEMSVITAKPCSASIIAETPVQLFSIRMGELSTLGIASNDRLQHVLYRTYAIILADKLVATNDKAKRFEATNVELLATRDALQEAHDNLEVKVEQRTQEVRERTHELAASHAQLEAQHAALLASHR